MRGLHKDGSAIRVMAVDDSPVTRKMIKKALEPKGFEIVGEAGNGRDAINLYNKIKPDVIIMDITMPIMDGLEAALAIKKLNPQQKIIMLSAMSDQDLVAKAKSWGINYFCPKPFKPDEMADIVIKVTNS